MNIKIVKLITGEEVLGEIESESETETVLCNPVGVAVVRGQNGQPSVGFAPFPLHAAEEGHVQGRGRRGRSQGRAAGDHRVPARAPEVPEARWPHPEGRAADGPPGDRQDAARAGRGRRGERALLLDFRVRFRRDVRRRRCLARARPLRARQEERALHRLHR